MAIIPSQRPSLFDGIDIEPGDLERRRAERLAGEFLLRYDRPRTQEALSLDLRSFLSFLATRPEVIDPLQIGSAHVNAYMRFLEAKGNKPATVNRRVGTVCTWYRWLLGEKKITEDPTLTIRRPKVPRESTTHWLGQHQFILWLDEAEKEGGYPFALACLLAHNGLRISEACNADVEDRGQQGYHQTLKIVGKGNQPTIIGLGQRTCQAIDDALDGRTSGPLLLNRYQLRMNRVNASVICKRLAAKAGIDKNVHPHVIRHSAITGIARETGGNVIAAQRFARHSDVSTTQRYIHTGESLAQSGSYVLERYLAGGD